MSGLFIQAQLVHDCLDATAGRKWSSPSRRKADVLVAEVTASDDAVRRGVVSPLESMGGAGGIGNEDAPDRIPFRWMRPVRRLFMVIW